MIENKILSPIETKNDDFCMIQVTNKDILIFPNIAGKTNKFIINHEYIVRKRNEL